jgi:small subunit ribosomal protein S7e
LVSFNESTFREVMFNPRSKVSKKGNQTPTELENEVAKALYDIEVAQNSTLRAELKDVVIRKAEEIDASNGKKIVLITFPYRSWRSVKPAQARLLHEMEKKFSKKHVVFVAERTMIAKGTVPKGMKVRK